MNRKLIIIQLIVITSFTLLSCRGLVRQDKANSATGLAMPGDVPGERYQLDLKQSTIIWRGSMEVGSNFHTGYVNIAEGTLVMDKGQLVGGVARMDMTSISDEAHRNNSGLIKHIKSPDFFDVLMYPSSTIAISKAEPTRVNEMMVTANLYIRGKAHEVKFPAKVELKEDVLKASGRLVIDRTDWDIRYQSGKFFGNLADKAIADSIEFDINIVAKKSGESDQARQ